MLIGQVLSVVSLHGCSMSPAMCLLIFLSLCHRDFLPGGRRDYTVQVQLRYVLCSVL